MSASFMERLVPCPACGAPVKVPARSGAVTCTACGSEYSYSKELAYRSYLLFVTDDGKEEFYEVTGDLKIGKDRRHMLTVSDAYVDSITHRIPIRTAYVSKMHSTLNTGEVYEVREIEGRQHIIKKTVCTIMDAGSKNGTEVNGQRLKEPRELKHGDHITLAPGCKKYVEIEYVERREQE